MPGPPAESAPSPPRSAEPPLSETLGLRGGRNFLLQHQFTALGRSYRVMNSEKRQLFTVKEELEQELNTNLDRLLGQQGAGAEGLAALGQRVFLWTVRDATGAVRGGLQFRTSGFHAVATLVDSAGVPLLVVNVDRSVVGGLTATAAFPDGRPMFQTHGNLIHHNFSIADPSGRELAKIHEAWASVRDTYGLDLVADVDPLGPLIFAIIIDREKESG